MKTVLLATGISKFDELLMEYLGKTYPGAFESVGYVTDIDSLLAACKQKNPAVLVVKDGLPGKADFLGTMRSIKAAIPDIRIVVLTKGRQAGDPFLTSLIIYNIYDFVAQDKVKPSEIAELVADMPRTFADVEKYAPSITGANEDKFGFATKVLDRSYSDGGRDIEDLNEEGVDPGENILPKKEIADAVSSTHADSAEPAELSDITLDEEDTEAPAISYPCEDDSGIEKVTIAPEGSKLGYRSVFDAFSLHRKGSGTANETTNPNLLFKKEKDHKEETEKAIDLSNSEGEQMDALVKNEKQEDASASAETPAMKESAHKTDSISQDAAIKNEEDATMPLIREDLNREESDKTDTLKNRIREEIQEMMKQIEKASAKDKAVEEKAKSEETEVPQMETSVKNENEPIAAGTKSSEPEKTNVLSVAPEEVVPEKEEAQPVNKSLESNAPDELAELYSRKNSLQLKISALMAAVPQEPETLMATVAAFTAVTSEITRKEKEIEEEKAAAEKTVPVQQKAVLGFFRGIPSMNTIALNVAVEIGKLTPVTFIDLHVGRDVYEGFFEEKIPNVTVFQVADPLRAREIVSQADGYVIIDSDTSEVFDIADTWMIMISQDRFVLESFRDKYSAAIAGLKFSYLYPNFVPNAGISEKKIGKLMGIPRRVVTLRDSEGLLGNGYVEKKPFVLDTQNSKAGEAYLEPVMKEAVKLLSPGIVPEEFVKVEGEEG